MASTHLLDIVINHTSNMYNVKEKLKITLFQTNFQNPKASLITRRINHSVISSMIYNRQYLYYQKYFLNLHLRKNCTSKCSNCQSIQ